jgi:dienelactone hydrolase
MILLMIILKLHRTSFSFLVAMLLAVPIFGQTATPGKNIVTIRGQKQEIHYYPATGARLNQKVLFVPGVGGWRGWAITVARTIASWGYDVYGLDTMTYLRGFTGKTTLKETDVMNDFRQIAEWMTNRSGERLALVGWSEGAALGVLGAAGENNKKTFTGLITFGLGDENVIGWRWADNITSLIGKTPNEPTFRAADYMAKVAPLPLFLIQSGQDEYTPLDEAKRLFALAREPKRFVLVPAKDHRFDGNQEEFFRQLREGMQWISQTH